MSQSSGWAATSVKNLLAVRYGKGLAERERRLGPVPVYGSSGIVGYHEEALVNVPVLVIGRKGNVGAVHLSEEPCWPIDTTYFIEVPEGIDPRFLAYQMRTLGMAALDTSTAIPSLRRQDLERQQLRVAPTAEQHRIVAAIEEQFSRLDAGVESLERARRNLRRMQAAVLYAALTGRFVPQDTDDEPAELHLKRAAEIKAHSRNRRHIKQDSLDNNVLPAIPMGWSWATIEDCAERVTVGHVGPMKHQYVPSGIPFLRSQNVRENRFDPEGLLHISPQFDGQLNKSRLSPGDVVIVRSGSVGVACTIPETLGRANCADLVIVKNPLAVESRFLSYYMNSLAKKYVRAGQVGVALTHFNTKSVAALPIPVPPAAEQRRIVESVDRSLSIIATLEQTVLTALARATTARSAVLNDAFSGRLVDQDSTDESAALLLKRIHERNAFGTRGRANRD